MIDMRNVVVVTTKRHLKAALVEAILYFGSDLKESNDLVYF